MISLQNSYNEIDRLSNRNQISSLNVYSRQNQDNSVISSRSPERENERSASRPDEIKLRPMETTSTSPIPQRLTLTKEDKTQQWK